MDENCFSDNYVGGWFEILPNLGGPCEFVGKHFTGHGEVCNLPWDYTVLKDSEEEILNDTPKMVYCSTKQGKNKLL